MKTLLSTASAVAIAGSMMLGLSTAATADQVFNDDVIITFSLCVGNDCVNGESFGFDTIRLKENNLRIGFNDTSVSASFPTNDWEIEVNSSQNGGANYFAIDDVSGGRTPFRVEAGAPTGALWVDSAGDVGIGQQTPVVDLHVTSGNTPTLRLEQNGTSGFASQTFDVAANEANFFIRDVTNSSRLSFRIRPGAPESSVDIAADGDVGLGTSSPSAGLDVVDNTNLTVAQFSGTSTKVVDLQSTDNGAVQYRMQTDSANRRIVALNTAGTPQSQIVFGNSEVQILGPTAGDVYGTFTSAGLVTAGPTCNPGPCDGTFDPSIFEVPSIEEHAQYMWDNQHLWGVGPTRPGEPINLTEKTAGILHELEVAHIYIEQLNERITALENETR
ncbi:hypothetical protein [Maricaulis sp.]|uniref:hypothetical protein n=1 Tax=Maricaulis sp. TaxID=1486257 RepID=UPI002639168A|nr:hypothetical protein [Maricaulis sp.]